jgi:large subunit ribosomal protein L22
MKAVLNQIRVSPKKAQLVAALVRNKSVVEAQEILKFTPKNAAKALLKVLSSAANNAENNFNQKIEDLTVKEIHVGKGIVYKRYRPISRGRSHPILKKTSNITVEVGVNAEVKPAKAPVKKEAEKVEPAKKEEVAKEKPKKAEKKEAKTKK